LEIPTAPARREPIHDLRDTSQSLSKSCRETGNAHRKYSQHDAALGKAPQQKHAERGANGAEQYRLLEVKAIGRPTDEDRAGNGSTYAQ